MSSEFIRRGCLTVLLSACLVTLPHVVHAQVIVTEIMYDLKAGSDSGREWMEVYNAGASGVKLTDWKLSESGTDHKIKAIAGGDTLPPGSYAVVVDNLEKFKADWPTFSGQLFDSTFSLSNSGETMALRNASSTDDNSITYQTSWGAAGDGNSLNRAPNDTGAFVARAPSPGSLMSAEAIPPPAPKQTVVSGRSLPKGKVAPAILPVPADSSVEADTSGSGGPAAAMTAASEIAATPTPATSSYVWWFAAIALALAACGALVAARHAGKKEWDIVEEKG